MSLEESSVEKRNIAENTQVRAQLNQLVQTRMRKREMGRADVLEALTVDECRDILGIPTDTIPDEEIQQEISNALESAQNAPKEGMIARIAQEIRIKMIRYALKHDIPIHEVEQDWNNRMTRLAFDEGLDASDDVQVALAQLIYKDHVHWSSDDLYRLKQRIFAEHSDEKDETALECPNENSSE